MINLSVWKKASIVIAIVFAMFGITLITATYTLSNKSEEMRNSIDIFRNIFISFVPVVCALNIMLSKKDKDTKISKN